MIITVDGPAGAGKGTISAHVAKTFKLAYFDTGMVYRAVGLQMVLSGYALEDKQKALELAENMTFPQMMALAKHKDFRSDIGSRAASVISAYPEVRAALLKMQRDFALNPVFADGTPADGVIYDGRDTGTVICPEADVKFFVTAPVEIRAQRRHKDYVVAGIDTTYETVLAEMKKRDERDQNRASAPLKPAPDAVMFDTSLDSEPNNLAKVVEIIKQKLNL